MKRGLLLFAHGARDPRWALPFEDIARRVRAADPGVAVSLAYLEFMSPGLVEAGTALVGQGCEQVEVLPLFLGAGGHVRKDVPNLMAQLQQAHPEVTWSLRPTIGEEESVIEAMARCALRTGDGV